MDKQITKMDVVHMIEYYLALKKKEILARAATPEHRGQGQGEWEVTIVQWVQNFSF